MRWPSLNELLFLLLVISYCHCEGSLDKHIQDVCSSKQTCSECIQTPTCQWCSRPGPDMRQCYQPNINQAFNCHPDDIFSPENIYSIEEARELSKGGRETGSWSESGSHAGWSESGSSSHQHHEHEAVQISPQKVNLKLRINEAYVITVDYAQAQDYPVDLYYLMDLSKSMEDDKEKLSALGGLLAESMQNITSNFRLGFGSFVDKVVMPYVSVVPKNLIEPCPGCHAPYGFQNVMSLSKDTDRFAEEVGRAAVSGNLDAPEGGFDAIMQAVVCKEQIGWRDKARRLLVFSTDAGFHYAGDGKLGGIVKPNDGFCHLDVTGLYTHSTIQDYPSISQINYKVKENAINLIFAVTQEQIGVYDKLRQHIEGSFSGTLSADSSNVVELVKAQYDKITSSVELKHTASDYIKVNFFSNCINDTIMRQTNHCDGLKVGTKIRFQAEIEVKECPKNRSEWIQTFDIVPVGLKESLKVTVEMQCECSCEKPGNRGYIENAVECSGFGTQKCGVCACDPTHYGRRCECDLTTIGHTEDTLACRADNVTLVDCNGRGTCVCGQCQCNPRSNPVEEVTGRYCECDNFSCDHKDGVLCSGPQNGRCVCGKCECLPGWSGPACDCKTTNEGCMPPDGGEICSGHGVCECGQCKCDTSETGRYSGRYCDKCPTCPGRCQELKDCVQCQVYQTGRLTEEECADNCTLFTPVLVSVAEVDEEKDENLCAFSDEEDCKYAFVYGYDETGRLIVRAQKDRQCPSEVFIFGIVIGLIAAIVLIGIALLVLWKVFTTIQDRREFAKFEKEKAMAKWNADENPLYKQATSTFKNPTYAGK